MKNWGQTEMTSKASEKEDGNLSVLGSTNFSVFCGNKEGGKKRGRQTRRTPFGPPLGGEGEKLESPNDTGVQLKTGEECPDWFDEPLGGLWAQQPFGQLYGESKRKNFLGYQTEGAWL